MKASIGLVIAAFVAAVVMAAGEDTEERERHGVHAEVSGKCRSPRVRPLPRS